MLAACLVLATLYNSALFAGVDGLWVGRAWVEGRRLEALVVTPKGVHTLGFAETDEGLYGLAQSPDGWVAVGFSGEGGLVVRLDGQGQLRAAYRMGKGLLWSTDGVYALGGLRRPDWDVWVLRLADQRSWVYPAAGDAYAYSSFRSAKGLWVVGRTAGPGGFDAFWMQLDLEGRPKQAWRSNLAGNDYLRYVGAGLAVGRAEQAGDSEGLLVWPDSARAELWRRPGFDYFRMWRDYPGGRVWVGEAEVEGERRGLWIASGRALALGPGLGSLRFLEPQGPRAVGFSYGYSPEGQGWITRGGKRGQRLQYRKEPLALRPLPLHWRKEQVGLTWEPLPPPAPFEGRLEACPEKNR